VAEDRYRPLIAVVAYHLADDRVARWPEGGYGIPKPYLDALRRAGARTAIVPPGEEGAPEEILEPFDGLLLVGGGDVEPARYGATSAAHLYGVEPDRDELEIALLRTAEASELPTLCICRGMQVMNVAFGGTLHGHLPDLPDLLEHGVPTAGTQTIHDVAVERASRVFAATTRSTLSCSSHHHQGVDHVGDGLLVTGRSSDGLVEAVELPVRDEDDLRFFVGVQWHPEDAAAGDPSQQALFDALTIAAGWRGTRSKSGADAGRGRSYEISDYDEAWPGIFEREAARIRAALGGLVVRIDHVGSTAVPGLAAKPIIDIQLSLRSLEPREAYVPRLQGIGFAHRGDPVSGEHEFLLKDDEQDRTVHLHVCRSGSGWERRHLAFRDLLRADPGLANDYARLKRKLATEHPRDVMSYIDAKTAFIRETESRARLAG
jgi:putative glutamine amidotransferase